MSIVGSVSSTITYGTGTNNVDTLGKNDCDVHLVCCCLCANVVLLSTVQLCAIAVCTEHTIQS